jgi:Polysaccharide biosynthesis protein.
MNERKIGIVISYVNIFLHALVGFLYVPLLLFYIGSSGYGLYQLIGSFIAYFSIMDFGLTAAVVRFYAKYKALNDIAGMENILAISLRGYGFIAVFVYVSEVYVIFPESDICRKYDGKGSGRGEESVSFTSF